MFELIKLLMEIPIRHDGKEKTISQSLMFLFISFEKYRQLNFSLILQTKLPGRKIIIQSLLSHVYFRQKIQPPDHVPPTINMSLYAFYGIEFL